MSTTHTPGPWSLETVKTASGICHKVGPFPWRDGKDNHACIYVDYPNGAMGKVEAELKANARLIAAAPDLLAALIELADNIGAASLARNPYGKELRAKAAAAIARATPTAEGVA